MELVIRPDANIKCIYSEAIDLASLGTLLICRASAVEPDDAGRWWTDLALSGGGRLGPFERRSEALNAETRWLQERLPILSLKAPSSCVDRRSV